MIETTAREDEFYIGYEARMPARIGRRVKAGIATFACGAAVAVGTASLGVRRLPEARFEYGVTRTMTGTLRRAPYPALQVDGRRVWLVGRGKFGAGRGLAGIAEGPVRVAGSPIERGRHQMLEMGSGSIISLGGTARPEVVPHNVSDRVTLRGEIVDSKCFLGVMNPGEGAVHRDCAVRCLSGGMPPMLVVRDGSGREELVVLVSENGGAIGPELRRLAGIPIEVTGRLVRDGSDHVLFVRSYESRH